MRQLTKEEEVDDEEEEEEGGRGSGCGTSMHLVCTG